MPATAHFSKLPASPDDSSAFQAILTDDLSALLGCVDEQLSADGSTHECGPAPIALPSARLKSNATGSKRKRSLSSDDDDVTGAGTRVRTYTARKKGIEALTAELPALEAYVDYLKHQAAKINNQTNSTQKQQLGLAAAPANAVGRQTPHAARRPPLHARAHRVHGPERAKIRAELLRVAVGDYCVLKFVVMPLEGDFTARQAFDMLKFYLFHMEIMISEATGDLTLCDEEEPDNQAVSQHRFLRSTPSGFQVESKDAIFSQFEEHNEEYGGGREYGALVIDCVNKDDLHPYPPPPRDTKLRQDLTSILTLQTYQRQVPSLHDPKKLQTKTEVVMARSNFFKLHRTSLPLSGVEMQETIDRLAGRGNLLFKRPTRVSRL